jgi:uncharacterized protein
LSYAIDVNVLLYASDASSPFAKPARAFLEKCASGPEVLCLAWSTLASYVRLATHPAIFASPLTPDEAGANVESLLALPHTRVLAEREGFWDVYRGVTHGLAARGNEVPDAWLAALLLQNDVATLYTNDRDFRRYDFLKVVDPLGGAP